MDSPSPVARAARRRKAALWIAVSCALLVVVAVLPSIVIAGSVADSIVDGRTSLPDVRVALVLSASVDPDGLPGPALEKRLVTALDLYRRRVVPMLLLSGDSDGREVAAMLRYLVERGVPASDLLTDPGSRRTYDSCVRARQLFALRTVLVVSQIDHVRRAIYTCRSVGIEAFGVAANEFDGPGYWLYRAREVGAQALAWAEVVTASLRAPPDAR